MERGLDIDAAAARRPRRSDGRSGRGRLRERAAARAICSVLIIISGFGQASWRLAQAGRPLRQPATLATGRRSARGFVDEGREALQGRLRIDDDVGRNLPRPGVVRRLGSKASRNSPALEDVDHPRRDAARDEDAAGGLEGQREIAGEAPEQAREQLSASFARSSPSRAAARTSFGVVNGHAHAAMRRPAPWRCGKGPGPDSTTSPRDAPADPLQMRPEGGFLVGRRGRTPCARPRSRESRSGPPPARGRRRRGPVPGPSTTRAPGPGRRDGRRAARDRRAPRRAPSTEAATGV